MERETERTSQEVVGNQEIKEVDEFSGVPKEGITSEEMELDLGGSGEVEMNNMLGDGNSWDGASR
ncbi:unnamed protein product, partial [Cuscuta epithymum]